MEDRFLIDYSFYDIIDTPVSELCAKSGISKEDALKLKFAILDAHSDIFEPGRFSRDHDYPKGFVKAEKKRLRAELLCYMRNLSENNSGVILGTREVSQIVGIDQSTVATQIRNGKCNAQKNKNGAYVIKIEANKEWYTVLEAAVLLRTSYHEIKRKAIKEIIPVRRDNQGRRLVKLF